MLAAVARLVRVEERIGWAGVGPEPHHVVIDLQQGGIVHLRRPAVVLSLGLLGDAVAGGYRAIAWMVIADGEGCQLCATQTAFEKAFPLAGVEPGWVLFGMY